MKRISIIIVLLFCLALVLSSCSKDKSSFVKSYWDISIPNPKNIKYVYYFGFQEVDACEIWIYDKKTLEGLTKNEIFLKVTEKNIVEVQHYFANLYKQVTVKEHEKFNKLVSKGNFIKTGDYFCFKANNDINKSPHKILLLYLDLKENYVLTFVSLW